MPSAATSATTASLRPTDPPSNERMRAQDPAAPPPLPEQQQPHPRDVNGSATQHAVAMTDDTPNKRKRSPSDDGDRESKKASVGEHGPVTGGLSDDVGPKYLLCQTPHPPSLPRVSEDLYAMFNLTGLAAEVARVKPNGEKNALRKTYKGHMKRLGVAGHFDVTKKPDDSPSDFLAMVQVPDLEWDVHQVKGKDIADGLSDTALSSLGRAMTMSKGPIPKSVWDTSVLGDLAPSNGDAAKSKPGTPGTPLAATPGATNRPSKPSLAPGNDPSRPKRNIKKRGYGDSSFDGYGEGYPDDEGGYSTGEGEGGHKRRKKASFTAGSLVVSFINPFTERDLVNAPERHAPAKLWPRHGRRVNRLFLVFDAPSSFLLHRSSQAMDSSPAAKGDRSEPFPPRISLSILLAQRYISASATQRRGTKWGLV